MVFWVLRGVFFAAFVGLCTGEIWSCHHFSRGIDDFFDLSQLIAYLKVSRSILLKFSKYTTCSRNRQYSVGVENQQALTGHMSTVNTTMYFDKYIAKDIGTWRRVIFFKDLSYQSTSHDALCTYLHAAFQVASPSVMFMAICTCLVATKSASLQVP